MDLAFFEGIPYNRAKIAANHGVLIVGQNTAMTFNPPLDTFLIRIKGWNPTGIDDFMPLAWEDRFHKIEKFYFDDLDRQVETHNKLITDEDADRMVQFFNEKLNTPDTLLMIHCQGGISRSTAVGMAWAYFTGNKELEEAIMYSGFAVPNTMVYRTLVNAIHRMWEGDMK